MIRSFHGTIRSYHGMIRPFHGTNDLFRLNASYKVIIFDWFSFGPRSVLVHPSFFLRSSFVRDSFGIRRTIKEATEMYLRHNEGTTKAQRRMNEAKTEPKRKGLLLPFKTIRFAHQKDSFYSPKRLLLDTKRTTFRN